MRPRARTEHARRPGRPLNKCQPLASWGLLIKSRQGLVPIEALPGGLRRPRSGPGASEEQVAWLGTMRASGRPGNGNLHRKTCCEMMMMVVAIMARLPPPARGRSREASGERKTNMQRPTVAWRSSQTNCCSDPNGREPSTGFALAGALEGGSTTRGYSLRWREARVVIVARAQIGAPKRPRGGSEPLVALVSLVRSATSRLHLQIGRNFSP